MKKKQDNKSFWNRYARLYDFEIHKFNRAAYQEMYRLMSLVLTKEMNVLELATGTGLIALNIADASALSFADQTFDAVIISNALHIMPDPELVLNNIKRVLKPNGILIAPSFSHGHLNNSTWKLNTLVLKLIGFETYSKWKPEEYLSFISKNGFTIENWKVLRAAFPLVYLEARLNDQLC